MIRPLIPIRTALMLALLALTLVTRMIVPAGFMPVAAGHGMTVTLCTGTGAVDLAMDIDRDDLPPSGRDKGAPCIFAAGLGNAALLAWPALSPMFVPSLAMLATGRAIADLTPHRLSAPPPPAHAPPASVQA